ncbi:MAG TPA: hypothetical protein VED67_04530 [Thermodesulfovibrionales bacterium]|nr:hypothetical protein [Thermodesulfovibrionales bacterium]
MPFDDSAVPVEKYRDRYSTGTEQACEAVVPSDRKGDPVGLRELPDLIIAALGKDADEADALAPVNQIGLLKIGGLIPALRSPVRADVHYRRRTAAGPVRNDPAVKGREREFLHRICGMT